jgi:polysaccharide pyruvyl transferase CsaB
VKIAVLGYYGFDNLGDEAVLAGILQTLRQGGTPDEITVLSNAPEKTEQMHPGVRAVSRWQRGAVSSALSGTDTFIFGGGSLLQDATSVKSVLWYTLMALLARKKSRKMLWWGQGVGPLSSPLSRRLIKTIAHQADALTVRDEKSAQLLKEIGVRGSIDIVADPAFGLAAVPQPISARHGFLFAPREWETDMLGQVIAMEDGLPLVQTGAPTAVSGGVTGLPMHLPHDREYLERLGFGNTYSPLYDWQGKTLTQILERVATSEMMVSVRLHSLIFAARVGVPFVALSYDPKVTALAAQAGQEDALLPLQTLTAQDLKETIAKVRETQEKRCEQLLAFSERQAVLAQRPGEILRGW